MGRGEGVILDVKFLIFDWGRDCSRKAPTRVRGRVAKPRRGSGRRRGSERNSRCENVRKCECVKVVLRLEV